MAGKANTTVGTYFAWQSNLDIQTERYGQAAIQRSADRNHQLLGSAADLVGPPGGAACIEIQVDTVLAELRDLSTGARIGHSVDHTQRRIAEMRNAGGYQIWRVQWQHGREA